MKLLATGQFFGNTDRTISLPGITLTDTVYTHSRVDWHHHENAYFTFLLAGKLHEGNRKEKYDCGAGSLLFHNWQEAHYNIKPAGYTRGFHLELSPEWVAAHSELVTVPEGSSQLRDARLKLLFYRLVYESFRGGAELKITTESLLLEAFSRMGKVAPLARDRYPSWVPKVRDLLHATDLAGWKLSELANEVGVHPVYLSRAFPRYFGCTIGAYVRSVKVTRALALLADRRYSVGEVAAAAGFSDRSHFVRCFREGLGVTPLRYRKRFI